MPVETEVQLTEADAETLRSWLRTTSKSRGQVTRARIIPALADGASPSDVADARQVSRKTVHKWKNRFARAGVEGRVAQLERRAPYRGGFTSVKVLKTEIRRFIKVHNRHLAKPFQWTRSADRILGAVGRAQEALPR